MKTAKRKRIKKKKSTLISKLFNISLIFLCLCFFFYIFTNICVKSYNITLSAKDQNLSMNISSLEREIEEIEAEISQIKNKKNIKGNIPSDFVDNKNNIYIINEVDK